MASTTSQNRPAHGGVFQTRTKMKVSEITLLHCWSRTNEKYEKRILVHNIFFHDKNYEDMLYNFQ